MITRRQFLQHTSTGLAAASLAPGHLLAASDPVPLNLTPAADIEARVRAARPLLGGKVPADLVRRLGATHYAGRYCLTEKPYLVEGAEALHRLGFGVAKFWFNTHGLAGYGFHSHWDLAPEATLADMAKHPYFVQAFSLPFTTFTLEIPPIRGRGNDLWLRDDAYFTETERQTYDLALHLLETYRDREVTFILQNWEGDWMTRDYTSAGFAATPGPNAPQRFAGMRRWFTARQSGVNRAQHDANPGKARILHAIEVNKVLDTLQGVPTLTSEVLPQVQTDLISWSSYDGMKDAVTAWHGVEIIRHFARPLPDGTKPRVFIGEIGNPENLDGKTRQNLREWWDTRLAVFLALDLPWIIHWELYCNEPKDKPNGRQEENRNYTADELRGFWLLRPDASLSHSGEYLTSLLPHAGRVLPDHLRQG